MIQELFILHPKSQYLTDDNGDVSNISSKSKKNLWFRCFDCNHTFQRTPYDVSTGKWCLHCTTRRSSLCDDPSCIRCFKRSFASYDEKVKYWSDKNDVSPREVAKGSKSKYFFDCDQCNHDFRASLDNITQNKSWCPFCGSSKLCDDTDCHLCFQRSFASHEKSVFWSFENEVTPRQVSKSSSNKYYFNCVDCNHIFQTTPSHISAGQWCSYCPKWSHFLCNNPSCIRCFKKSFASYDNKVKYWSAKNDVSPREVAKYSSKKFIFDCDQCGHEFTKTLSSILFSTWCPYCSNTILCNNNECQLCFKKSFASHEKAIFWSLKNELIPRQVFRMSNKRFIFNCQKCCHEMTAIPLGIVQTGAFCGYCGGRSLCQNIHCIICFNRSFASHPKSSYWSDKNKDITPRQVFKCSFKKFIFDCDRCGNEFIMRIAGITRDNKWCSKCYNKTELMLYSFLLEKCNNVISQFQPEWIGIRRFDFCLDDIKVIIELDGPQHFKQVANWTAPEITQQNDKMKMELANQHGYSVIRLLQPDVFNDKYDWQTELLEAIQVAKGSASPSNIFLCKDNEYDIYLEENGLKT